MKSFQSQLSPAAALFWGLTILVLPLVFTSITQDPALYPKFFVAALVGLVFSGQILLAMRKEKPMAGRAGLDLYAFLLSGFLIFVAISALFATNKAEAINELAKNLVFATLFFCSLHYLRTEKGSGEWLLRLFVIQNLILSLGGWIQFIGVAIKGTLSHLETYQVSLTFAHRNLFSMMIFLAIPFLLVSINRFSGRWRSAAFLALILSLSLITVLLTKSVWVAILLSSLLVVALFLNYSYRFEGFASLGKRVLRGGALVITILVVSGYLYTVFDSADTLKKQTDFLTNYRFGSSLERLDLWERTASLYRDHLVTGVGPGNWKIEMPALGIDGLRSEKGEVFFVRAHNDFLQTLSETGLPGFLFYLGIFILPLFRLISNVRSKEENAVKIESLFLIFGLMGYMVFSFLDFPRERMEHNAMLAILLAYSLNTGSRPLPEIRVPIRFRPSLRWGVFVALSAFGVLVSGMRFMGEVYLKKGLTERDAGQWEGVIQNMNHAENLFFNLDDTSTPIAWYRGSAWFNLGNQDKAFTDFAAAFRFHPNHLHVLNNLGTSYEIHGDHIQSIDLYSKALQISKSFDEARLNRSIVYFNQGNLARAAEDLRLIRPDLENDNYIPALRAISAAQIAMLIEKMDEPLMKSSLGRIQNSGEWVEKVFRNSLQDNMDFEKRVIQEVIYLTESMDKSISPQEADLLREKYLGITRSPSEN